MITQELLINDRKRIPKYYCGRKLFDLLDQFTFLKHKEETNLVDESDQIVATLNLLRYLIIADKIGCTEIDFYLGTLEDRYFKNLKTGIDMSKEHYNLKIKEVNEEESASAKKKDCQVSVTVSGKNLMEMSSEKKIEIMNLSLLTLDVIDSLLSRVIECDKILAASLPFVVELGWSKQTLGAGARAVGYPEVTHGLFPKGGADLVLYFQRTSNLKLVEILRELEKAVSTIPPAEFVEKALQSRLKMTIPYLSRWPQAIAIMSLPPNVPSALATILTTVDDICYYAGDRSVNFNWYVRRLGVAGVYKATELYLIQDKSPEYEATWKFLNRRLAEAVQIHEILCKSDIGVSGPKDAVTSAFVTVRHC
ncbi:COQ9 and/or Kinetochor Ybp2 domain containing protein [Asbolus verrucosus]|uniref:Ubiquinone biosynthesis protein n=1 Tax=Asbolus verrucosus TaxID=1661398 RepID=A0A482W1R3_ASBVE|nr:COQ9 and/or Kinetochor Ybp2 domain containing protein [Asbolus verrucosus]